MDKNTLICWSVDSTFIRRFYLKFTLKDSNPPQSDSNPFIPFHLYLHFAHMNSNPSIWIRILTLELRFLSVLSEGFALEVKFIFETLSNLIRNNNTSVLISSKSNKGSTSFKCCPTYLSELTQGQPSYQVVTRFTRSKRQHIRLKVKHEDQPPKRPMKFDQRALWPNLPHPTNGGRPRPKHHHPNSSQWCTKVG